MLGSPTESVVVTGIGLVSCLGHTLDEIADALESGRSGIVREPERIERGFRSALTGRLPPFDTRQLLARKERRSMGEPAIYGAVAALRALEDAALDRQSLRRPEVGVIVGNDSTCFDAAAGVQQTLADGGTRNLGASAVVKTMNSGTTMNLSVLFGTQGANWTVSGACASGAHAIGQAAWLIASGQQDVVICGGVQEVNWQSMAAFDGQGTFSVRDGDPAEASRPFDAGRDGLVPSGGGAVLILESARHARARDARVRAELLGYGFSSDGHHITTPTGEGARRCMERVLQQARMTPGEVEFISAHATSTPLGDAAEARAIAQVFGERTPPVTSTKGLTGHECWMSGASEVAYALLMAERGFLAANRNLEQVDPVARGIDLVRAVRRTRPRRILSNSFGFGGTNSCLLLGVPE